MRLIKHAMKAFSQTGKQRLLLTFLVLLTALSSAAFALVDYLPSDLGCVAEPTRAASFKYHNDRAEQFWYGTNQWAVFYDIAGYTEAADTLTLQEISVYFPYAEGRYDLRVYTDELRPLEELAWQRDNLEVAAGWNRIDLDEAEYITHERFWVVVRYETNMINRFLAASNTGGTNSYFWVPPDGDVPGHFTSMQENNSTSEFLVTIAGELDIEGLDIEVLDFWIGGDIEPQGRVYPVFEIRNNSDRQIDDDNMSFRLDFDNPTDDQISFRVANETVSIAPGEVKIVAFSRSAAQLSETPAQYRIRGELVYAEDNYPDNNFGEVVFDTFNESFGLSLLENFIRSEDERTSAIIDHQSELEDFNGYRLNMFFHRQDRPYYSEFADLRRDFYGFYGYPFTAVNGIRSIGGYRDGYADKLDEHLAETARPNTFLRFSPRTDRLELDLSDLRMELAFTIQNRETYILKSTSANIRMFAALTEKNVTGMEGNCLLHLYPDPNELGLNRGTIYRLSYSLGLHAIDPVEPGRTFSIENLQHFEVVYWVQDIMTKDIYFIDSFGLDDFTLNAEDYADQAKPGISVHPNPFSGVSDLSVSMNSVPSEHIGTVEVYNIKGQLVKKIDQQQTATVNWNGNDLHGNPVPTGIYFLKVHTDNGAALSEKKSGPYYRRISIIR